MSLLFWFLENTFYQQYEMLIFFHYCNNKYINILNFVGQIVALHNFWKKMGFHFIARVI